MANNQYVNKVEYGGNTLIDLTNDTIAADKILSGYTAHDKSGASITGTIPVRTVSHVGGLWSNGVHFLAVTSGYYSSNVAVQNDIVSIPVPSSGENNFTVRVPNGTTTPDILNDDDWIPITIKVDSSGNSNVTDDTIVATGVSF